MHGSLQQAATGRRIRVFGNLFRKFQKHLPNTGAPCGDGLSLQSTEVITDLVPRDGPEPATEAVSGPIAAKCFDAGRYSVKDFLANVCHVRRVDLPAPAPGLHERIVEIHQAPPGLLV